MVILWWHVRVTNPGLAFKRDPLLIISARLRGVTLTILWLRCRLRAPQMDTHAALALTVVDPDNQHGHGQYNETDADKLVEMGVMYT